MVWCYQGFWVFDAGWWEYGCVCASFCYTCGGISFSWGESMLCVYFDGYVLFVLMCDCTEIERERKGKLLINALMELPSDVVFIFWMLQIEDNSAAWMKLLNIPLSLFCLDACLPTQQETKWISYWLMHLWNYRLMLCSYFERFRLKTILRLEWSFSTFDQIFLLCNIVN